MPATRDGPIFYVRVVPEGQKAERLDESHRVLSFTFEDNDSKADKVTLVVENDDLRNFDDPVFRKGGLLEVSWGYEGNMAPARECVIQKVTGFRKLTVEGYAKSILMHKQVKSRSWRGLSRSQVVEQVAQEWGFDAAHRQIESTVVVHDAVTQARQTDAQFLASLARREFFQFYVDHTGLHFHQRRFGDRPRRVLHWFSDPGQGDVIGEPVIENDVTARPGKVTVKGRDPLRRKNISVAGSNSETSRTTLSPTVEVIDAPTETTTSVTRNLAAEDVRQTSAPTAAQAKREADGGYTGAQRLVVKLKAQIIGDPQLGAKQIVEWRGIGRRLSGNYYVRQVTSKVGESGFTQEIHCIRDGTAERELPAAKGQINKQKAPAGAAGSGDTPVCGAPLEEERIVKEDGTTVRQWRRP
jgi:phage protein D